MSDNDGLNDEVSKYLSLVREAKEEQAQRQREEAEARRAEKNRADALAAYIGTVKNIFEEVTQGIRDQLNRGRSPDLVFPSDAGINIAGTKAKEIVSIRFPHPKDRDEKGTLWAAIGIAKVQASNDFGWVIHEYSSSDCGSDGTSRLRTLRVLQVNDSYTRESVRAALKQLLSEVNALYINPADAKNG